MPFRTCGSGPVKVLPTRSGVASQTASFDSTKSARLPNVAKGLGGHVIVRDQDAELLLDGGEHVNHGHGIELR